MSEEINIVKKIYGKDSFSNAVNVKFSQLIPSDDTTNVVSNDDTIDSFFQSYNNLFFQIPPSGSDQSHMALIIKSSEYIGINIDDLSDEIRTLRDENVSLKNQLFNSSFGDQNVNVV